MTFRKGDVVRHILSRNHRRVVSVDQGYVQICTLDDGSTWIADALELVRRPPLPVEWAWRIVYRIAALLGWPS